ncbi:MAG: putative methyltransferase [Parcubacteria group bacterium Greene1014_15]|nr:MAG: putative methyltransferase [Parcubacteria group bacterium Greene1014_15]
MTQQVAGFYGSEKVNRYYNVVKGGSTEETGGIDARVLECLLGELPMSLEGLQALDLGCGDGRWSEVLHKRGAGKVIALDRSVEMLARASRRKKEHRLDRLLLLRGDMQELPLQDASVHIVLASFCLMYFPDLNPTIGEIARVLAPDGSLFVATNLVEVDPPALTHQLKGKVVPINARLNEKKIIELDNVIQPRSLYFDVFRIAGLSIRSFVQFEPEGLTVAVRCPWRSNLRLF